MNQLKILVKNRLTSTVESLLYQHLVEWGTTLCLSIGCLLLIGNLAGYYGTEGVLMGIMVSVPFFLMFLYSFAILRGIISSIWKFPRNINIPLSQILMDEGLEYDSKLFRLSPKEKAQLNQLELNARQVEYIQKLGNGITFDNLLFLETLDCK